MSNIAIEFENISKQYRLGTIGTGTLSHDLNRWWHQIRGKEDPYLRIGEVNDRSTKASSDYVWALKDISFKVEQGEVLGIIGKNGAGKSTLLKILSRITSPSTGSIKAKGRIASLLEVGTGFHGDLTGRENIYMNGAIMGMTRREITSKLDEIVAFSGIEKYIDTPVKRYSSGMTVRLGFAVAAHLEPEILVVDEVLAVGDAEFQKKAIGKMKDVSQGGGRTVLFVSHQLNSISALCNNCVLLKDGTIDSIGKTDSILNRYLSNNQPTKSNKWINEDNQFYSEFCTLKSLELVNQQGQTLTDNFIANNEIFYVKLSFEVSKFHSALCVGFAVYSENEELLFWTYNTDSEESERPNLLLGQNILFAKFPKHLLNEGAYVIKPLISLHFIDWIIDPEKSSPAINLIIQGGLSNSLFWQERRPGIIAPIIKYKTSL